jgi:hypothetical protein
LRMKFRYLHEVIFIITGAAILTVNFLYVAAAVPFLFPILNIIGRKWSSSS